MPQPDRLAGSFLRWWLLSSVPALGIGNLQPTAEIGIDLRVASFAVLLSMMTTVRFGLAPAWLSSKGTATVTLRESSWTVGGSSRARNALVIVEAALALTLLIGAGLLSRSLWQPNNVPTGFQAEGVLGRSIANITSYPCRSPSATASRISNAIGVSGRQCSGVRSLAAILALGKHASCFGQQGEAL